MAIGKKYQKMTYPSFINKTVYCKLQGYPFHFYTESLDTTRPIPWTKVLIMLQIMEDPEVEWVFWTDADSLIMNPKIELTQFINNDYDMITASDENGINTGQFLMKNCEWSKNFLHRIYAMTEYIHDCWWEQRAITVQLANSHDDMSHVLVLEQREINSYAPEIFSNSSSAWQKGDFLIHFAGIHDQRLVGLMNKYSKLSPCK
jgi:hypothetical protein